MYGVGNECYFLDPADPISGTDALVSTPINAMSTNDIVGAQLVVDDDGRDITHDADDAVVAGTGNWRFDNGAFTAADIGGTITVAGASNAGNNGTFTILTVPSATHITTATTGLVNETFDADVTVSLVRAQLEGAWTIEISNNYTPSSFGGDFGQDPDVAGSWTDITSAFSPTIAAVDTGTASSYSQYVQATICVRAIRFTFTATSGHGYPRVLGLMRSYS